MPFQLSITFLEFYISYARPSKLWDRLLMCCIRRQLLISPGVWRRQCQQLNGLVNADGNFLQCMSDVAVTEVAYIYIYIFIYAKKESGIQIKPVLKLISHK